MSTHQLQVVPVTEEESLTARLRHILNSEDLSSQRLALTTTATELAVDVLDCGAVLLYMLQQKDKLWKDYLPITALPLGNTGAKEGVDGEQPKLEVVPPFHRLPTIKMVRYRLDIGKKHQLTVKELKKVLIEESGVDKNNINNVMIHGQYTLLELPDEMPQDIFQHLKTVEINNQKLNIRRLKTRSKKQTNNRFRRNKQRTQRGGGNSPD